MPPPPGNIQILNFGGEIKNLNVLNFRATAQGSMEETGWRCPLLSAGTGRLAVEGNRAVQGQSPGVQGWAGLPSSSH